MKKITLFLCIAFATQVFSAELICAPDFEVIGMNADFAKSSAKVLQGKMEAKNFRQLVLPSATDSIAATDDLDRQTNWARGRSCSYLLQTTLTRLGENVQVNTRLMELGSGNYPFRKIYKASSPDDLYPIFEQIGNALQDDKFTAAETIYDVTNADAKALTKKNTSGYWEAFMGGSYHSEFSELIDFGLGFSVDNRTFIGEFRLNWGMSNDDLALMEIGLRMLYPFSNKNNSFYLGGGVGWIISEGYYDESYDYVDSNYGLLLEATAGYLIGRTSGFVLRVEGFGNFTSIEKSIGAGGRLVFGIGD